MKKITLLFVLLGGLCSIYAQTVSTGTLVLQSSIDYTGEVVIDDTTVTITLSGPDNLWLGLGFGVNTMTSGGDVVTYDATGFNDRQFLGVGVPPTGDTQDWTVSSNTVSAGVRTLVATRDLVGSDTTDFTFDNTAASISLVWARGNNTDVFGNHGQGNRGAIAVDLNPVLSVNDANLASSLSIFPVPASELVTISMGAFEFENASMEIYSMLGQLVQNQKIDNKSTIVNISALSKGIYILNVSTENGFATAKIIKE
tara:strand:+ start:609 stop:1376 length:768 start_codon:yes stop_codon:yes gene_type:complete